MRVSPAIRSFAFVPLLCAAIGVAGIPDALAQKNFDAPPAVTTPPPAAQPRAPANNSRFTLINNSDMVMDTLNISPVAETEWGDDLLGTLSLPAHSKLIAGPKQDTGCMFDVRVMYHDRREEVLRRQNLCDLNEIAFNGRNARLPQRRSQTDN